MVTQVSFWYVTWQMCGGLDAALGPRRGTLKSKLPWLCKETKFLRVGRRFSLYLLRCRCSYTCPKIKK